ncbi:hypothetical protein H8958_002283 [Nasalis larvatus]
MTDDAVSFNSDFLADSVVHIPKEKRVLSFWRCNLANVIRYFPTQALNFAFKDKYQQIFLGSMDQRTHFWHNVARNLASGSVLEPHSCVLCTLLILPVSIYQRMWVKLELKGNSEALVTVWLISTNLIGLKAYVKALPCLVQGIIIYPAAYFSICDTAKGMLLASKSTHIIISWMIAQPVIVIAGLTSYPFDTVHC